MRPAHTIMRLKTSHLFLLIYTLTCIHTALAAPFTPATDATVLEHLPFKAGDATLRELRSMRAELTKNPHDLDKAVALSQRYFRLAQADGDPRFIGYAQAALTPWWEMPAAPVPVLVQRATLRQYSHQFDLAMADLTRAISLQPRNDKAWSLMAAIYMVQADYAEAKIACEKLHGLASKLIVSACIATVDSLNGRAMHAYATLQAAYLNSTDVPAIEQLWVLTRLAEMSDRLAYPAKAEEYFQAALGLKIPDAYLLAVYAEFLLDEKRYSDVINLLKDKERSDVLLMRLALAEKAIAAPKAAEHEDMMRARFEAARMRGDKLHIQDEARYYLHFRNDPAESLRLARENWQGQHEPSDARILLEAALASKSRAAAQPALLWYTRSRIEDRHLLKLVKAVEELKS